MSIARALNIFSFDEPSRGCTEISFPMVKSHVLHLSLNFDVLAYVPSNAFKCNSNKFMISARRDSRDMISSCLSFSSFSSSSCSCSCSSSFSFSSSSSSSSSCLRDPISTSDRLVARVWTASFSCMFSLTFKPIPTIMQSFLTSINMPPIFLPSNHTSLGHLIRAFTPTRRHALVTATTTE